MKPMELSKIYNKVDMLLNGIDFGNLFSGFRRYRFALYTSDCVCLDGVLLPCDERFRGNTAIRYDDEFIAIWSMDADLIEDIDLLASSLVHEMFHCHQYTLGETRFPSDLRLLNYPGDIENFARKYRENCLLADACEHSDETALHAFAAIRNLRLSRYPEMVKEELKAETAEGMAEYIGLKALALLNTEKFETKLQSYLGYLRAESALQFDIRRISYYTGTIFLLCLDRMGYDIRNEIGSALTIYEQNPIPPVEAAAAPSCAFIETAYAQLSAEKDWKIEDHIACTPYTECDGEICGYDPMNMFRRGNRIYCSHFILLKINGETKMLPRRIVLVLKDGSDREIIGYY